MEVKITPSKMNRLDHLLVCLAEECSETAQRATKALRFGPEESPHESVPNNMELIVHEFNDIVAIMEMIRDEGFLPAGEIISPLHIELKKERVENMLIHSKECRRLCP